MAEWLTRWTSYLLAEWVQTPSGARLCFLEQETYRLLMEVVPGTDSKVSISL
jgi:hypothetical protein